MTNFSSIDFSDALNQIREKYGKRFYFSEDAQKEASELWGCNPNKHGVCRPLKNETIVEINQCKGGLNFYETAKGYWLFGISAMSGCSGIGYAPSVWSSIGYPSYDDMRLAGVIKLSRFFEDIVNDKNSCNSASNRASAKEALSILKSEKIPQLTLF